MNKKICQTELLNTRTAQTPKTPKCILLMHKTWKTHGKCRDFNRSGTGQNSIFQTKSTPPLATKLSLQHNFI